MGHSIYLFKNLPFLQIEVYVGKDNCGLWEHTRRSIRQTWSSVWLTAQWVGYEKRAKEKEEKHKGLGWEEIALIKNSQDTFLSHETGYLIKRNYTFPSNKGLNTYVS
jgi:hypothetical protein